MLQVYRLTLSPSCARRRMSFGRWGNWDSAPCGNFSRAAELRVARQDWRQQSPCCPTSWLPSASQGEALGVGPALPWQSWKGHGICLATTQAYVSRASFAQVMSSGTLVFWVIIGALKIKVPHFDTLGDITMRQVSVLKAFSALKSQNSPGTSLAVQWLRLCTANAEGVGSIPVPGTKIPHNLQCGPKL